MAFKSLTSHVPEYLSSQFIKQEERSGRATRSSEMLNIPLFKTVSGQRTIYYRTVSIWNSVMSLCGRRGFFVAIIYILTFALVLPVLCHKLGFSTYFAKPKEPYKPLEIQNDERTKHARENLETLKQRTKPGMQWRTHVVSLGSVSTLPFSFCIYY